ncbi:MAG: hypothetical protein H6636_03630 [Anaerolineales bacterium]|nr:hypothetical protein [Anaerolineales bacterium]
MDHKKRAVPRLLKLGCWTTTFLGLILVIVVWGLRNPTRTGVWDGAFPEGEFHLIIENVEGKPIPGAVLHIFGSGTTPAYSYPFDNYDSENELVSNEQGIIVALHKYQGMEFGGGCYEYLWFYEKCTGGPEYFGKITADGYQVKDFSINELIFQSAYEEVVARINAPALENGGEDQMPMYEIDIVLENQ